MTDDEKKIHAAGYNRGYAAGLRRKNREMDAERRQRERAAFMDRALIAVLPAAMQVEGWRFGDKTIRSTEDRVKLAMQWAEEATRARKGY